MTSRSKHPFPKSASDPTDMSFARPPKNPFSLTSCWAFVFRPAQFLARQLNRLWLCIRFVSAVARGKSHGIFSQNQIHIIYTNMIALIFLRFCQCGVQRAAFSSMFSTLLPFIRKVIIKRAHSPNPRNAENIRIYMNRHKVLVCICTAVEKFCPFL